MRRKVHSALDHRSPMTFEQENTSETMPRT